MERGRPHVGVSRGRMLGFLEAFGGASPTSLFSHQSAWFGRCFSCLGSRRQATFPIYPRVSIPLRRWAESRRPPCAATRRRAVSPINWSPIPSRPTTLGSHRRHHSRTIQMASAPVPLSRPAVSAIDLFASFFRACTSRATSPFACPTWRPANGRDHLPKPPPSSSDYLLSVSYSYISQTDLYLVPQQG